MSGLQYDIVDLAEANREHGPLELGPSSSHWIERKSGRYRPDANGKPFLMEPRHAIAFSGRWEKDVDVSVVWIEWPLKESGSDYDVVS